MGHTMKKNKEEIPDRKEWQTEIMSEAILAKKEQSSSLFILFSSLFSSGSS